MKTTTTLKPVMSVIVATFCLLPNLSTAQTKPAQGGLDAGGGNAVGGQLFDDVENSGSKVMEKAKVAGLVEPLLKMLDAKLPGFAADLRASIKNVTWYMEIKPLDQNGPCKNKSSVLVDRTVVACQSKIQVRIDEKWFNENTGAQAPLLLHELLVSRQLRLNGISDESIREISRQIRNPEISAADLKNSVKEAGFGFYITAFEKSYIAKLKKALAAQCTGSLSGNEDNRLFSKAYSTLHDYVAKTGATGKTAEKLREFDELACK